MSYNTDSITDNCYEGTTCLINKFNIRDDKFNIRDEKQLNIIESQLTLAKISLLNQNPINGNFDFNHYKSIHKFIFEDLYDLAGEIRTIDISKKGTLFVKACDIEEISSACFKLTSRTGSLNSNIEEISSACFKRLKNKNYFKNLNIECFIDEITDFYSVTNNLHPFREGNGRTQRTFLTQLAHNAGYEIDFSEIDADDLLIATIHSSNGVNAYLKNILTKIISPLSDN